MAKVQIICIYLIKNPTGRIYIGQTWDLNKRYKSGVSPNQRLLYRSYQKHGKENHTKQIIHHFIGEITQQDIDYWERRYIDLYKADGYELLNIREGGGNNGALSNETKELLRQRKNEWIKLNPEKQKTITAAACASNIGKKRSEDTKKLMSQTATGKQRTEEHCNNISKAKKGKPSSFKGKSFSEASKKKLSESKKGNGMVAIVQYDLSGNIVKEWPSIKEAAETLNLPTGTIGGCVRRTKHYKTCGGFIWRYKSDHSPIVPSDHKQSYNPKECPVAQIDMNGKEIAIFGSIKEAVEATGTSRTNLIKTCRGQRNKAGGFIWKYK